MNDDILYNPTDLDIGAVSKEHVDQLIETLDIPEIRVTELSDDEDILEVDIYTYLEKPLEVQQTEDNSQLLTPSPTLSVQPTPSTLSNDTEDETLPAAPSVVG